MWPSKSAVPHLCSGPPCGRGELPLAQVGPGVPETTGSGHGATRGAGVWQQLQFSLSGGQDRPCTQTGLRRGGWGACKMEGQTGRLPPWGVGEKGEARWLTPPHSSKGTGCDPPFPPPRCPMRAALATSLARTKATRGSGFKMLKKCKEKRGRRADGGGEQVQVPLLPLPLPRAPKRGCPTNSGRSGGNPRHA